MTFDATPKSSTATSMATVEQADDYHAGRLHNEAWSGASAGNKQAALMWASRILSKERFKGYKSSSSQSMAFPRQGLYDRDGNYVDDDVVPSDVVDAVSEYAFLLIGSDSTVPSATKGFKQIKVSVIDIKPDSVDRPEGVPSSIIRMLDQFISRDATISVGKG
jgi:hypothetical protein